MKEVVEKEKKKLQEGK